MIDHLSHFKQILKKKGTGKTMSKHMDQTDMDFVVQCLKNDAIPLATKATLLTAWIMLDKTPEEASTLAKIKEDLDQYLPPELTFLFLPGSSYHEILIHQAMNGDAISATDIDTIFNDYEQNVIQSYTLTSFLEALRLKEETFTENCAVYDAFQKRTIRQTLDLPILIDFATPYDGFNRSFFLQPFICALLAAVGIPSVIHGVEEVSPKKGMNTHKVLMAANKTPLLPLNAVKSQIENPLIGWAYVDQGFFCPSLSRLIQPRIEMVKRPVLATIEKWLQPFSAKQTICVTGFTHPPYKQKTLDIIQYANCYDQLILVRGVEGSTLLPPDRRAPFITMAKDHDPDFSFISPEDCGFESSVITDQTPEESLIKGIEGLTGKNLKIRDFLCYQVLAITQQLGLSITLTDLTSAIHSGKGFTHWENANLLNH